MSIHYFEDSDQQQLQQVLNLLTTINWIYILTAINKTDK